tara:strand:+ start:150 stop:404 length:255 start_codon:yes stop_codon:yes gene_type:complete
MQLLVKNKIFVTKDAPAVKCVCPVCGLLALDKQDLAVIEKENACRECTENFKYLDLEAWERGVRPTREKARKKILIDMGEIKNE